MKNGSNDARVAELVDAFLDLQRNGGAPGADEFVARHADVADDLRAALKAAAAVEGVALSLRETRDLAGRTLGTYRLVREIGRGGMGVVYEAEDVELRRRVALKVLPATALLDPRQLQRFRHEAQAAAQLHHTSIVPVHGVGSAGGVHFYAMQYIEGTDLATVIEELRAASRGAAVPSPSPTPLSSQSVRTRRYLDAVCRLGIQAAEALDHAHQVGVVHRDVKPGNLLVDATGHLWVTDFGLAQFERGSQVTRTGDLVGTLRYMSPEQALGKRAPIDHRTDVYSLGATLYELVTLTPVLEGETAQAVLSAIATEEPAPPRSRNPAVPAELETILLKALAKEPAERYDTAQELADDLRRLLDDRPIAARPPTIVQRARKWARRHRTLVGASAIVVVIAVAALSSSVLMVGSALGRAESNLARARDAVERFLVGAGVSDLSDERPIPESSRAMLAQALRFYEEFLADRRDADDHLARSRILHVLRRYPEALEACDEALALGPADPACRTAKAHLLGHLGREAEALALLVSVIQDSPRHAPAYRMRSILLVAQQRYVEALAACDQALETDPRSADHHCGRAGVLLRLGRLEEALAACSRAIEIDPRSTLAHRNRAWVLMQLSRFEEALAAHDRALELDPLCVSSHVGRGQALLRLWRYGEALAALDRAVEVDPGNADAHHTRGNALDRLDRREEALAALDRCLEIDPWRALAHCTRGEVLLRLGRYAEALAALDRAVEIDPRSGASHVVRGRALVKLGRFEEALAAVDRCLETGTHDAVAHRTCGEALLGLGRSEEALVAVDRCLETEPEAASAHITRSQALLRLGRSNEALVAADRALEIEPELALRHPGLMNDVAWFRATTPLPLLQDAGRAVALAEMATRLAPAAGAHWNTLGVALCRAERWGDANAALERSMKLRCGGDPGDWLFVAMARHELGEKEEARKWLDRSVAWMEERKSFDEELRRFRAEAQQVLGGDGQGDVGD